MKLTLALPGVLAFTLLSFTATADEMNGELMDIPTDFFGQIYLVSAGLIGPDMVQALTFRKSPMSSNYSDYVFNCAMKTYAPLAGKMTVDTERAADKALVLQAAKEALAKPYKVLPLVNDGLDALTFQIARHVCNNVLSTDIAQE